MNIFVRFVSIFLIYYSYLYYKKFILMINLYLNEIHINILFQYSSQF